MNRSPRFLLIMVITLVTISVMLAGTPGQRTVAQGGLTEADLGTSYFLTVQDFEEATGTQLEFSEAPMLQ